MAPISGASVGDLERHKKQNRGGQSWYCVVLYNIAWYCRAKYIAYNNMVLHGLQGIASYS